mmetsp:Transcript_95352/g.208570  ORF Transcript_95352/g.208570 Transcript_95352/m.208570 type:complete len:224 (+) Transcript_95352:1271-1942(+)
MHPRAHLQKIGPPSFVINDLRMRGPRLHSQCRQALENVLADDTVHAAFIVQERHCRFPVVGERTANQCATADPKSGNYRLALTSDAIHNVLGPFNMLLHDDSVVPPIKAAENFRGRGCGRLRGSTYRQTLRAALGAAGLHDDGGGELGGEGRDLRCGAESALHYVGQPTLSKSLYGEVLVLAHLRQRSAIPPKRKDLCECIRKCNTSLRAGDDCHRAFDKLAQ